jgi:hypothetical protein
MRTLLLATTLGFGLLAGIANAAEFTDSAQRMKFDAPAGWATTQERSDGFSYVVTGTANNECHFLARPNTGTASAAAEAVRRTAGDDAQFGESQWVRIANSLSPVFPGNSAQFVSRSSDTSGFWPIQRAELRNAERAVHGAMQIRPGMDLIAMCQTYGGADSAEAYDAIIRSFGTPNDATLQAAAADQAAQDAATAAANAADAAAQETQGRRRRN